MEGLMLCQAQVLMRYREKRLNLKNWVNLCIEDYKTEILDKICYTELVYRRINKKLNVQLSKEEIERMIYAIIEETDKSKFQKKEIYLHYK